MNRVSIRRIQNVFVISDDGVISKMLGLNETTSWEIVSPTADRIGPCVEQMERTIANVAAITKKSPDSVHNPATMPYTIEQQPDDLDTLSMRPGHLARLRRALAPHGISRVDQLAGCTEEFLTAQNGIGPTLIAAVKKALAAQGVRLAARVGKTRA